MTTAMNPKEVAQQYVAAVQAGDEQAIRNLFATDATWTLAGALPISGVWKGRTAIIDEFLATAMSHYQPGSISLEITGMIAEHDQVVLQWTSRARHATAGRTRTAASVCSRSGTGRSRTCANTWTRSTPTRSRSRTIGAGRPAVAGGR